MDHSEAVELLGAYALDAVDADEGRAIESHVAVCKACREELEDHQAVTAVLASVGQATRQSTFEGIISRFDEDDGESITAGNVVPFPARSRWMGGLMAAAAALALVFGGLYVAERNAAADLRGELVAAESRAAEAESALAGVAAQPGLVRAMEDAVTAPGSVQVSLGGDTQSGTMTIVLTEDGTGYVADSSLPTLQDGRTYQLWAVVDGRVISAGVLGRDPGIVPFRVDTSGLEALAITEEIEGGVAVSENPILVAWSK